MFHAISLGVVRHLTCRHCGDFVSCGPVHVLPDSGILCGRCQQYALPKYRNFAYEAIASIYRYPCRHWTRHCDEFLVWNESLEHEPHCAYGSSCRLFCSRPSILCKSERTLPEDTNSHLEYITEDILNVLRCASCEGYLSCSPVHILDDGKNICHRCSASNGIPPKSIRNVSYETLAHTIFFPCNYRARGCSYKERFGKKIWQHEHECSYQSITRKLSKRKERGVIQTHSGHYFGTITPHSALFSPHADEDSSAIKQELQEVMKKKQVPPEPDWERSSQASVDIVDGEEELPPTPTSLQKIKPYLSHIPRASTRRVHSGEIMPSPAPIGYNRMNSYGHFLENGPQKDFTDPRSPFIKTNEILHFQFPAVQKKGDGLQRNNSMNGVLDELKRRNTATKETSREGSLRNEEANNQANLL